MINIILTLLLIIIIIVNLINLNINIIFSLIILFLLGLITYFLYKKNFINSKVLKIIGICFLILGIGIRIFLLLNLKYNLSSDFALYYNTGVQIMNHKVISNAQYLAYNGYVCVFSSILALVLAIYESVTSVIIFNFICQLLTCFYIYKILNKLKGNLAKYILPGVWFIIPAVISANFLVSTETLFMMLFTMGIYFYLKLREKEFSIKLLIEYLLLGIFMSFMGYIRPVAGMLILTIVLELIRNFKKKNIILSLALVLAFFLSNLGFNIYAEKLINEPLRGGALGWAVYYGSNYIKNGYWSEEDAIKVNEFLVKDNANYLLIKESLKRYKDLGVVKSGVLFAKKYYLLWTNLNANFEFLMDITDNNDIEKLDSFIEIISFTIFIICLALTIYKKIKNIKNNNLLFLDLFLIIYILANLLFVVNGRYNYPIYLLLIIYLGMEEKMAKNSFNDKVSKLVNVYKKYGFKGFCKKLYAYIKANYLDKISFKVFFHKRKFRNIIKDILRNTKYDRIILWRSSFGYNVPLYQRPQHIASNLAKENCLVFYEVTTMTDKVKTIKKFNNHIYLTNFNNILLNKLLMNELLKINKPKYIELYSTDWKLTINDIENYLNNGFKFIYEYIDHLSPELAGTKSLPKNIIDKYEYVMKHDDVFVVVTASDLKDDVVSKRGRKNLIFSSNGVDYKFFESFDEDFEFDEEFKNVLAKKKPIVCYYGALAKWFDYDLIKKIAKTDKYSIVLFGIKYDDSFDNNLTGKEKNIYFLGSRDYKILKNYARKCDILTIPFLLNDITKATSPVKIFEYMALHKPIVITDLKECRQYKSVMIGHNHEEFIKLLDKALEKKDDNNYINLLDKEARENDWEYKAQAIINEIKKKEK